MIEYCNYCQKEHETGDGSKLGGIEMKVCPEFPSNQPPMMFNPKEFLRFRETHSGYQLTTEVVKLDGDQATIRVTGRYASPDNIKIFH